MSTYILKGNLFLSLSLSPSLSIFGVKTHIYIIIVYGNTTYNVSLSQQNARLKAYEEILKNKVKDVLKHGNVGK